MRCDSVIWGACLGGRPDWADVASRCGITPDDALARAQENGAIYVIGVGLDALERTELLMRLGRGPEQVASELGTDVHGALLLAGMAAFRRR